MKTLNWPLIDAIMGSVIFWIVVYLIFSWKGVIAAILLLAAVNGAIILKEIRR